MVRAATASGRFSSCVRLMSSCRVGIKDLVGQGRFVRLAQINRHGQRSLGAIFPVWEAGDAHNVS